MVAFHFSLCYIIYMNCQKFQMILNVENQGVGLGNVLFRGVTRRVNINMLKSALAFNECIFTQCI